MLTIVPIQDGLNSVEVIGPRTSVGAHDSNTLIIPSASVSDFHAEFHVQNNEVVILDLGSESGTILNGKKISGRVRVKHNDIVKVGDIELKLITPELELAEQEAKDINSENQKINPATEIRRAVSGWVLVGKPDSSLPGELPIEGVMIVGRDEDCDFSIPVSHISRRHAQFEIIANNLNVKDLGSTNGTSVNGEKIAERELQPGDTICFDTQEFLILGPVKENPEIVDKTMIREAVTSIVQSETAQKSGGADKKKQLEKQQEEIVADDYKAISEDATDIGKIWQENDGKASNNTADNKTVSMSSVDVASDNTRSMPAFDEKSLATLECRTKPLLGVMFNLSNKINTIGRTDENDIEINESSVSSKHAQITYEKGAWLMQDLGSYNGTFVNNKKRKSKKLKNGDVINFGRVQLIFSSGVANEKARKISNRKKWLPPCLKVPILLVKTIVLLVVVSVISEFAYNYILKLEFDSNVQLTPSWENITSNRINSVQPLVFDMNNDGVDDVIITSENGIVEVIDGGNGFNLSSFDSNNDLYSSPLLIDVGSDNKMDIVVVSSNGLVIAFDVNGSRLWTNTDMQGQLLVAQAVAVNINKDNVKDIILPTENNGIVILDGETGNQLVELNDIKGKVTTRPVVQDINRDGVTDIVAITDLNQILAFSIQGTKIRKLWEVNTPPVLAAPLKYGQVKNHGVIFVATQNDGVLALNSYTGNKIWQSKIDGLLLSEPVLVDTDGDNINDAVVQTTFSGNVVSLGTTKGDQIWELTLPNKLQAEPVVLPDATETSELLFVDTEGEAHTVNIKNGNVSNSIKIDKADRFVVSPVLRNKTLNVAAALIFTSQNGNVFLYEIKEGEK